MLQSTRFRTSLLAALAVTIPLALMGAPAEAGWGHGYAGYYHGWGGHPHGWGGGWHGYPAGHGGTFFGFSLSVPLALGYGAPWPYPYAYPAPPAVIVAPAPPVAVPTSPTYLAPDGRYCREFQMSGVVNGRTVPMYGTACLDPDGNWRVTR